MNVALYADETGTHDPTGRSKGAEVMGIAGYLSWADDWASFCDEWRAILEQYQVPRFHFSDFADKTNGPRRKNWPYQGWSEDRRERFLYDLGSVARKRTQFGVGGFFSVRSYDKILPIWFKRAPERQYELCAKLFFEAVLTEIKQRWKAPSVGTRIAFLFDQNTNRRWKNSIHKMFDGIKLRKDHDKHMDSIAFVETKDTLPLRAADLLAYRMRQVVTELLATGRGVEGGNLDRIIAPNDKSMAILFCGAQGLKRAAADLEHQRRECMGSF
jgi:hypothetical protein